ncbi:MAG: hypothetical protein KDC38_03390, partial [Planctomycetes bacterium]|nr:hypothetical protein [Planctomycetota bacterium]
GLLDEEGFGYVEDSFDAFGPESIGPSPVETEGATDVGRSCASLPPSVGWMRQASTVAPTASAAPMRIIR